MISATGSYPHAGPFACPSPITTVSDSSHSRQTMKERSHNPACATPPGITHKRFGLIRFRSPLLPESRLFSLPAGTEMFHFPAFPPHCLCVQQRVTAHDDCRVSHSDTPDHSLVDSPGPIVASHVLHRFLVPRHPPCALKNLATDARVHCAVLKQRPATRHNPPKQAFTGPDRRQQAHARTSDTQQRARPSLSRPCVPRRSSTNKSSRLCRIVNVPPMSNRTSHSLVVGYVLLRKEVIQPHLPVRLLVTTSSQSPVPPSTASTRVGPPASGVTDFRDVTGGVYKARTYSPQQC